MKILTRFLILTDLLGCLMTLGFFNVSAAPTQKTVLVLSPFQVDLSTNLIAAQAMRDEFGKAADVSLDIFYEYLDLNRFTDPVYQQEIFDLLKTKYKNKPVDLVIVGSEAMLKLWLVQRAEILPDTPLIFFDVTTEHLPLLELPANVTGISGVEDCEVSVRWALKAMPAINEIVLVSGVGKIEQGFFDHIEKLQEDLKGQVRFTNISNLSYDEIKQRIAKLPKTSIILYHPMFEDADGNKHRPNSVLQELTSLSSVPIIGGYDQFIGTGIIGGYMYSIDQQARDAAQISLRVIRGEAISTIPVEQNESNRFVFDHLALQRFNIPLSLLPADSIIKNRQYSVWELYRLQIILACASFALLLVLIFILGVTTQRLRKSQTKLEILNESLESKVQERTTALSQTNRDLELEIIERKQVEDELRENQRRMTTLMSNLPGLAYRCHNDLDWTMEFVSEGCQDLTGYAAEDLIDNHVISYGKLIHPDDQTQVWEVVQSALKTQSAYDTVYRIITLTGFEKWVMERGQGVFSENGELLALEGFISDITERKRTEDLLLESEEKFCSLLDSQEGNIMMLDYDGVHHYVNQSGAVSITGPDSGQDIIGMRLHDLYPEHIADWQLEQIRQVITTGQGISGDYQNIVDNQSYWWHLNLQPIRNAAGQVSQVMVNSFDITKRKHAEQALRESEERFHTLADTAPVFIWMAGPDMLCNFFNKSWLDFTGRTMEQELGNGWIDSIHPDDVEGCLHTYSQAFQARQPFSMEYRLRRADGEYRWIVDQGVARFLSDGSFIGYIGSCLDISDRRLMEEELRDSERRTATILRLSPIVIGVSTVAEGRYTDVNDAFEHVLGFSQSETAGRTSHELNLWVGDETRSKILREIQSHGRVENLEIQLRRKSGEIFPALIFITPINLHDTPCLLTMMMDITERKRVEEQLRETRDAMQTIIYSSPLAILALDAEDRVTMWNPAAEEMFGWSDKQILGQANPTVPENKVKEYDALRQATLNGMTFSNLDTVRLRKDGKQIPVSLSVAPLRGQQSQVIGRLHIITDITERKKLQEDLRQQATTDELTRVSNRRHFIELAQTEIKRAIRLRRPPSVALIDIDHFKRINDTFGHAAGDQALIAFAKICQKKIREIDVFARFGGDEFVLLLPETNQDQAYEVVERIRLALTAQPIHLDGKPVTITISAGIASLCDDQESIDALLSHADQALYRAKETGRNTVVRFDRLNT